MVKITWANIDKDIWDQNLKNLVSAIIFKCKSCFLPVCAYSMYILHPAACFT